MSTSDNTNKASNSPPPPTIIPPPPQHAWEQDFPTQPIQSHRPQSIPTSSMNLQEIGIFIDHWADTIEGRAEVASSVRENFFWQLRAKTMPEIKIQFGKANLGWLTETRPYIVLRTYPGVTMAVYIAAFGKDLYLSWRVHVRGILNKKLLLALAIMAAFPTFIIGLCGYAYNWITNSLTTATTAFGYEIRAPSALEIFGRTIGASLVAFIGIYIFLLGFVAAASYLIRGNPFVLFFVEPSIFDAEDVSAMALVVHKALKTAIESVGIDPSILRPKPDFKTGRRSEGK